MRKTQHIEIDSIPQFKKQLIEWGRDEENFILLDSNEYSLKAPNKTDYEYDFLAAFGCLKTFQGNERNGFQQLSEFLEKTDDWVMGYLSYDLKNGIEDIYSGNLDRLDFPAICFFQPEYVIFSKNESIKVQTLPEITPDNKISETINSIKDISTDILKSDSLEPIHIKSRFSKDEYLRIIEKLKKHIKRGDVYEISFCQEFYADALIDPYYTYKKLAEISPAPFACFYKNKDRYLISSSPERFMRKKGNRVISQPIKGTRKRGGNPLEDEALKTELYNDRKERAENVMIVDLVRNDLSKTALMNSVEVDELYGIYSFEQVHQMISTVSCRIEESKYLECIRNSFPMGSMTGAPKVRAMELIEEYEKTKRGLYSGAVGYISPEKNFDFNVVIRSILYNSSENYVSYSVGGAITYLSEPMQEYEECLIKASAMKQVLNS